MSHDKAGAAVHTIVD